MKKSMLLTAGVTLALLSACGSKTAGVGDNMVNAQDVVADNLENAAATLDNQADALRNQADQTRDWAKDKQDVMKNAAKKGVEMNEAVVNKL